MCFRLLLDLTVNRICIKNFDRDCLSCRYSTATFCNWIHVIGHIYMLWKIHTFSLKGVKYFLTSKFVIDSIRYSQ